MDYSKVFVPIMFGDSVRVNFKMVKTGYCVKQVPMSLIGGNFSEVDAYYEIDGKSDVLFNCESQYGVMWWFPN